MRGKRCVAGLVRSFDQPRDRLLGEQPDDQRLRPSQATGRAVEDLLLAVQPLLGLREALSVQGLDLNQLAVLVARLQEEVPSGDAQARKQEHVQTQDELSEFHGSLTSINSGPPSLRNSNWGAVSGAGFGVRFGAAPAY